MTLDFTRFRPGIMVHATDPKSLAPLFANLKTLYGTASGQTEVDIHAPLAVGDYIEGTDADGFVLFKRYHPAEGEARLALRAESAEVPSAILSGDGLTLEQAVKGTGDAEPLADHVWSLQAGEDGDPRDGYLDLSAVSPSTLGPDLTLTPDGRAGVLKPVPDEGVWLDVNGDLNTTLGYQIDGVDVEDWTLAAGTPDAATWDGGGEPVGDALVSGAWRTVYHVLDPVDAASVGNLTLIDAQTVDGVAVVATDTVLAKNQTDPKENGVYTVVHPGAWTRRADAATWDQCVGAALTVTGGTVNAGLEYAARILPGGSIGFSDMPWEADTHAAFGVPVDVVSTTENPNLDTDKTQGSPWIVPRKRVLVSTAYGAADTQIGGSVSVYAAKWLITACLSISGVFADDGLDLVCKLKTGGGATLLTLTPANVKGWSDGNFYNAALESVRLEIPYTATGDETIFVTVSVPGGTGSAATGFLRASFVGVA